jgi:digeranylgeranylglycerophospholipid reductase
MIHINPDRCAYCGGCVSVCPVAALTLMETHLVVEEVCIDCGDCVSACPVGALSLEPVQPFRQGTAIREQYDVVVVGAGPGGSTAARVAAQAGLSVLLIEKRQEIGSPVRCAEGVGAEQLATFVEPNPKWIAAEIERSEFIMYAGEEIQSIQIEGGLGYILERRIFDRYLAELACQAGAEIRVKTPVTGLLKENGRVCGVKVHPYDLPFTSGVMEIAAQVVIAADGVESQAGCWAGLPLQLPLEDTMVCAQYLLAGVEIDPNCNLFMIGAELAPGGYAWVFPKGENTANVGLGLQANLWERAGRKDLPNQEASVLGYLQRFIENHKFLEQGAPVTLIAGNVPVRPTSSRCVVDGLLVVGDAARQVDPLTGGGIINAMTAGRIAARTAAEAVAANDYSAAFLNRYEQVWMQSGGRKNQRNYRLRMKFNPDQRVDERFVRAFALAAGG